jgi:hypothetical protein
MNSYQITQQIDGVFSACMQLDKILPVAFLFENIGLCRIIFWKKECTLNPENFSKFSSKCKENGFEYFATLKSRRKSWNFFPETQTENTKKNKMSL